jgi:hypothetical protein
VDSSEQYLWRAFSFTGMPAEGFLPPERGTPRPFLKFLRCEITNELVVIGEKSEKTTALPLRFHWPAVSGALPDSFMRQR